MKLTKYGRREWGGLLIIMLVIWATALVLWKLNVIGCGLAAWLMGVSLIIWTAVAAFFRDPVRKIPEGGNLVIAPADGTVRDIELIKNEDLESEEMRSLFAGQDVLRIGIFLSVLSVHVNRAPVAMKVSFRKYKQGAFHDARDAAAIQENEAMTIGGTGTLNGTEFPVALKQVTGAIARRIVCPVEAGRELAIGEIYGMLKFGSRTELFLPARGGFELKVKIGDSVAGGSSIIAVLPGVSAKN